MTTPCAIRAAAPWVVLYGAHSVGPSLAESWMAAEGPAGAPALARLSVERRAAFKDLRYSTVPMRVACVVDGPNASVLAARGCSATRTQKRAFYCLVRPRGLEPPRVAPLAPQASASTNSATAAFCRARSGPYAGSRHFGIMLMGRRTKGSKTPRPDDGGPCNK